MSTMDNFGYLKMFWLKKNIVEAKHYLRVVMQQMS